MATGNTRSRPDDTPLLLAALGSDPSPVESLVHSAESIRRIGGGGSDRQFFRLAEKSRTIVLMVSPLSDQEFSLYLDIGRFLRSIGVGAPEIYEAHAERHILVMEDLGDTSLQDFLQGEQSEEVILHWYEQVLDTLLRIQILGRRHWASCPAVTSRTFDYSVLRWETDYFFSSFVTDYCGIEMPDAGPLRREFHRLAERLAAEPLFVMHRDFQSQNIMIHQGSVRIIDFQGARKGLLQYDLASVLKDSYRVLSAPVQQKLLNSYLSRLKALTSRQPLADQFSEIYTLAAMQRTMQALGAFSFLSRRKGKTWFEQFIPAGLHHLSAALAHRADFPALRGLLERILEKTGSV